MLRILLSALSRRGPGRSFTSRSSLLILVILAVIPSARADDFRTAEHYSVRMFSYGILTIDTRVGDIDVSGWDNPRLSVDVEKVVTARSPKKARRLYRRVQVRVQGKDHRITLSTIYPSRRPWRPFRGESRLTVNLTIKMPYDANLRLKCVDGDVTVSGIVGGVYLNDNYGDVEVDVPDVYNLRVLDAHSWLGYVQSDLHGMTQQDEGFGRTIDFRNPNGSQVIIVRVRMGGVWVYGNDE